MGRGRAIIAAVAALVSVGSAYAQATPDEIRYAEAARVLLMPFDVTNGHVSFQIVSRIGGGVGSPPVETHWVYYAADCRHLANVFITLTQLDTVVVDPTRLQGQTQIDDPRENRPQGPVVNLTGERGVAIVTVVDPSAGAAIAGGWTIANPGTASSFGGDAVGLATGTLPDASLLASGIRIPTFNPAALTRSTVMLLGLESDGAEVRPISRPSTALGGAHVCCSADATDNLEVTLSIPDVCFDCVGFTAITSELADDGVTALLPATSTLATSGLVRLRDCRSATTDGDVAPVGSDIPQFLVALHGQSVGPFGFVVTGKYSGLPAF